MEDILQCELDVLNAEKSLEAVVNRFQNFVESCSANGTIVVVIVGSMCKRPLCFLFKSEYLTSCSSEPDHGIKELKKEVDEANSFKMRLDQGDVLISSFSLYST